MHACVQFKAISLYLKQLLNLQKHSTSSRGSEVYLYLLIISQICKADHGHGPGHELLSAQLATDLPPPPPPSSTTIFCMDLIHIYFLWAYTIWCTLCDICS